MAATSYPYIGNGSDADAPLTERNVTPSETKRRQELQNASRNSRFVRIARIALPICCASVLLVYGLSAVGSISLSDLAKAPLAIPKIIPTNLTMDNPRYRGFNDDGGSYVVAAKTAKPSAENSDIILLNAITGELTDKNNKKTRLKAKHGAFDTKKNKLDLTGEINIDSDEGMRAKLKSATYFTKTGLIESAEPVSVAMPTGTLAASQMKYWQKKKEAEFFNGVKTVLISDKKKTTAGSNKKKTDNSSSLFASSGAPVTVNADQLNLNDAKNFAIYKKDVVVTQEDTSMSTRELEVYFAAETKKPEKKPAQTKAQDKKEPTQTRKVARIVSNYPILIKRGKDQQITGQKAEFLPPKNKAVLDGNVTISSGDNRRATSKRAEFDTGSDLALLTGDVIVRQNKNELRGQRLFVDRGQGKLELTTPLASGQGRIHAHLAGRPGAKKGKKKKAANPKPDTKTKTNKTVAGVATFKTSPGAPIDIEANRLNVDNTPKTAVFRGNVIAKQDTFTIRTSVMTVHYKGNAALTDATTTNKQKKPGTKKEEMEVTKIKASESVVVTSQAGQSATGDWGEFDMAANTAIVGGDVTLKQGKSVVKGSRLKINMTTGETVMDTSPEKKKKIQKNEGWALRIEDKNGEPVPPATGARSDRPSAVFYPNQLKKQKKGKKAKSKTEKSATKRAKQSATQPNASSSWQIQTAPAP